MQLTPQELRECLVEIKYSDIPIPTQKKIIDALLGKYKDNWITVEERLPKEGDSVLLQDREGNIAIGICKYIKGMKGFECGDWWASVINYLAWMPLPAPYREDGEV